jgi:hypothetical protein
MHAPTAFHAGPEDPKAAKLIFSLLGNHPTELLCN